jgi:mRNA-degrading endonuclease RelE of RelBE toxin-antitoxin system
MRYEIVLSRTARRALTDTLPPSIAVAVREFLNGPVADNPYRVGKPLSGPYEGLHGARRGEYRVIYEIDERRVVVDVIKMNHRRDAYR